MLQPTPKWLTLRLSYRCFPNKHGHCGDDIYNAENYNFDDSNFSDSSTGYGVTFGH